MRVASTLFPAHTSPGRGCAHNPTHHPTCLTPTPHLSHATLCTPPRMRDDVRVARERWGVGVRHAERMQGRAHTQCGARPASLQCPQLACLWVLRHPIACAWGRAKGRGGILTRPHANGGRGCLPRRLRAPSHPRGPSYSQSLPEWGRHLLCTLFTWAGSEQKGGGGPPPPSYATLTWVSGTQGGGCAAPAFPYLVGVQTSPRLCINGGDKGGAAGGPALGVLFDLSGGKGGKGGCVPLCAALHSPFAHRGGVAQPPRRRGRNGAPPALHTSRIGWGATGGRTSGGTRQEGAGERKLCLHPPSPL